eukprot:2536236-Pyramimonas_sp.AAC.1
MALFVPALVASARSGLHVRAAFRQSALWCAAFRGRCGAQAQACGPPLSHRQHLRASHGPR